MLNGPQSDMVDIVLELTENLQLQNRDLKKKNIIKHIGGTNTIVDPSSNALVLNPVTIASWSTAITAIPTRRLTVYYGLLASQHDRRRS